ncbi:MAG: hypothetical protein IJK42_04650 [Prevotella sp.]|nr:hypothetical protein [Prevotella sp.]
MKKMTFILACLTMAALSANAQISKVILQHQGDVTMYEPADIQTAIKAAVDGDTILLNKGSYPGFTVNKKISVIGAGEKTTITTEITIDIPNTPTLTAHLLESLKATSIKINKEVYGLKIKKCYFTNALTFKAYVTNALIDRCKLDSYIDLGTSYVASLKIKNSEISYIRGKAYSDDAIDCTHCYFTGWNNDYMTNVVAQFTDSWFKSGSCQAAYSSKCTYLKCILGTSYTPRGTTQDCWRADVDFTEDIPTLTRAGYIGTDGTVVGPLGGTTPYTLETTAPKVTDSSIGVTPDMKALNVNITVTPN